MKKTVGLAAVSPRIRLADPMYNALAAAELASEADDMGAEFCLFPQLFLTGATCGDLFCHKILVSGAERALRVLADKTAELACAVIVGIPRYRNGRLYNCAVVLNGGREEFIALKKDLTPIECRRFCPGEGSGVFSFRGLTCQILFSSDDTPCDDADIVFLMGDDPSTAGSGDRIINAVRSWGAASAISLPGRGESSSDAVYEGLTAVTCGDMTSVKRYTDEINFAECDMSLGKHKAFLQETKMSAGCPWLPDDANEAREYIGEMMRLQAEGLVRRVEHTGAKKLVLGVSGGLDSTLALLVCTDALRILGRPAADITAVTMPCFGTTRRTKNNAVRLAEIIGAELKTVEITGSVMSHFADIGHDPDDRNSAYENAQARERTQVLMDIANDTGGIVVGTGDMSELALGWATYNGDHMSMYGVNAGVPKTLVRAAVLCRADTCGDRELAEVLRDVADTPVSPELLPAQNGSISQITEDIVGPYELHDFFMYHIIRGDEPGDILSAAEKLFSYGRDTADKWLRTFIRRFFSQQFKRSCLPDGPRVLEMSLSPRGGLMIPSDALCEAWLVGLEDM